MSNLLQVPIRSRRQTDTVTISVVLVGSPAATNGGSGMLDTVRSVLDQTQPAHEVILVIPDATGLAERIGAEVSQLTVVVDETASDPWRARNAGAEAATATVVAFLEEGDIAARDWLQRLADAYRDDDVMGVGGSLQMRWERPQPRWFDTDLSWMIGGRRAPAPAGPSRVRSLSTANLSLRRTSFIQLGGFPAHHVDPSPTEDSRDLEVRLRTRGAAASDQLFYEPGARVLRPVPAAKARWVFFLGRCYREGRAIVARSDQDRATTADLASLLRRSLIPVGPGRSFSLVRALAAALGLVSMGAGFVLGPQATADSAEQARSDWLPTVLPTLPVAVALALWAVTVLSRVPVGQMNDLGLISVLPLSYWLGLAVLSLSFAWSVRRRSTHPAVLLLHVLALIVFLHATPVVLYGTLRYSWAWKHVGIVAYTLHHGAVSHQSNMLSAYAAWPGFFSLNAFLDKASGLSSALAYASWGPPFNELLFLGPVVLIIRTFTTDRRLLWMAVWIFYIGDWVGQDYFSPQAFAYFLYLTILAVCLRWFRSTRRSSSRSGPAARRHRLILYGMVVAMAAAIATSHQLTPFLLVAALGLLALVRRLRYRSLPIVVMAISVGWVLYSAVTFPFLHGNLYWIIQSIGHPFANGSSTFINLAKASHDQVVIAWIDRLTTAAVCFLAVVGYLRHRHHRGRPGHRDLTIALVLGLAPISAVLGNSYGGEVDFRVYFFALPFLALYASAAFFATRQVGRSILTWVLSTIVIAGVLAGFTFGYYGKERVNYFSPREVAAMEHLYATAPAGSLLLGPSSNLPWAFDHYGAYQYLWYAEYPPGLAKRVTRDPVSTLVEKMRPFRHAYLIFSKSQAAQIEMTGIMSPSSEARIRAAVLSSTDFRVVTSNNDITILTLDPRLTAHTASSSTAGAGSGSTLTATTPWPKPLPPSSNSARSRHGS